MIQAGLGGDVCKRAIAVVVVERIEVHSSDKQIRKTIVVVVANSDSVVIARTAQVCLIGYVRENAMTVVTKEPIFVFRGIFLQSLKIGAVSKKDVRTPVFVEVKDCHTTG